MQRILQRFPALLSSLICVVILPAVLCVGPALAQEKPEAPKPKHDRTIFIVGTALLLPARQQAPLPRGECSIFQGAMKTTRHSGGILRR